MFFLRKLISGNVYIDEATSGVFEYTFADSVLAGHEEAHLVGDTTTKIEAIDRWWKLTDRDYGVALHEMELVVIATTYVLLTDNEKRVALRNFVAGAGNNYVDILYTQAEHKAFYREYIINTRAYRELRDNAVIDLLADLAANTALTLSDKELFQSTTTLMRSTYVRDDIKGITYDNSIDGLFNWIKNDQGYNSIAITNASAPLDEIQVSTSITDRLHASGKIQITDSTGNDGFYIASVIAYKTATNITTIGVEEDIVSNTNDGNIWIGFKGLPFYSDALRDQIMDIYENGLY